MQYTEEQKAKQRIANAKFKAKKGENYSNYLREHIAHSHYTEDITKIQMYELAKEDGFNGWVIHHVKEEQWPYPSSKDLKEQGLYFNRPASELRWMRKSEHRLLHATIALLKEYEIEVEA